MAKSTFCLLVALLAVSKVNGDGFLETMKDELDKAAEWVDHESSEAKHALSSAVGTMQDHRREMKQKMSRIQSVHDRAMGVVQSAPEHCVGDIKKNLVMLKSSGVGSFLTCNKLFEASKDVYEVFATTGDIVFDVLDIGRDVLSGFSGCLTSLWPWRIVECWWDRVSTTYDDIKRTLSDIRNFSSRIQGYAHNASVLLQYCWDGNTVENDLVTLMTPLHQCAKQPVPHHLYKL